MNQALEELVAHNASQHRSLLIAGCLLMGFGAFAVFQWSDVAGFGYSCAGLGLLFVFGAAVTKPDQLREILLRRPSAIAWYHVDPKSRLLDGVPTVATIGVHIYLADGTRYEVGVPMARMSDILDGLGKVAPDAVAGFTRDTERDFLNYLDERPALGQRGVAPSFAEWRRNPLALGALRDIVRDQKPDDATKGGHGSHD